MIGRRRLALLLRLPTRRPLSTAAGGEATAATSTQQEDAGPLSSFTLRGKSRAELSKFHPYIRTAQVAEALRRGFQEGQLPPSVARCTSSKSSNVIGGDVEAAALLRAARARPSLLVPLAGSVGVGLRCLTQLLPGTAPVEMGKGLLSSIEETLDDGVRAMIRMEEQDTEGARAVKQLLKARRDGVVHVHVAGEEGEGGNGPLAQGTQVVCRTLLKAAERL